MEQKPEIYITDRDLAELAVSGLQASIKAGKLTEERAHLMYSHYFPDHPELFEPIHAETVDNV